MFTCGGHPSFLHTLAQRSCCDFGRQKLAAEFEIRAHKVLRGTIKQKWELESQYFTKGRLRCVVRRLQSPPSRRTRLFNWFVGGK